MANHLFFPTLDCVWSWHPTWGKLWDMLACVCFSYFLVYFDFISLNIYCQVVHSCCKWYLICGFKLSFDHPRKQERDNTMSEWIWKLRKIWVVFIHQVSLIYHCLFVFLVTYTIRQRPLQSNRHIRRHSTIKFHLIVH